MRKRFVALLGAAAMLAGSCTNVCAGVNIKNIAVSEGKVTFQTLPHWARVTRQPVSFQSFSVLTVAAALHFVFTTVWLTIMRILTMRILKTVKSL